MGYMINYQPICEQQLLSFDCCPQLTQTIIEQVKKEQYVIGGGKNFCSVDTFLHKKEEYKELIQWFDQCLDECKQSVGFNFNGKFGITQCWANQTRKGGLHVRHTHSNSLVSSVFYLTEQSAPTYFTVKSIWHDKFDLPIQNIKGSDLMHELTPLTFIEPVVGRLVLFPSSLYHGVVKSDSVLPRFSMSFNTFIDGTIGEVDTFNHASFNMS